MASPSKLHKKRVAGRVFRYSRIVDILNHNARLAAWVGKHRDVPYFSTRFELYTHVQQQLSGQPIDYLEFGVFEGESILKWAELNDHPDSRFYGFDSFEGLPEDWKNALRVIPKGHFSTAGQVPQTADTRVSFHKGWFQDSLRPFLREFTPRRLVVHNDSDLHSSTIYVLATLDPLLLPGSVIIFDEFSNPLHEFQAFMQYTAAFMREYRVLGASGKYYDQVAVELL